MKNDGGPAFPLQSSGPEFAPGYAGMTLRDYFAAKAMSTVPKQDCYNMKAKELHEAYIARRAYAMADAMLEARSKS